MKHKYYFPLMLAQQRAWALKYKENLPDVGALLGMTPAEIAAEQALCQKIIDAIDKAIQAMALSKQANKDKNQIIKDVMDVMRLNIRKHKSNEAYNQGLGELLGIIGEEDSIDPLTVKTTVSATATVAGVDIKFELMGCEGGNVYCKRGNEEHFAFFKHLTHPHSIDTRENIGGASSEHRQYYVNLVLNDEEVGQSSDIATVKV